MLRRQQRKRLHHKRDAATRTVAFDGGNEELSSVSVRKENTVEQLEEGRLDREKLQKRLGRKKPKTQQEEQPVVDDGNRSAADEAVKNSPSRLPLRASSDGNVGRLQPLVLFDEEDDGFGIFSSPTVAEQPCKQRARGSSSSKRSRARGGRGRNSATHLDTFCSSIATNETTGIALAGKKKRQSQPSGSTRRRGSGRGCAKKRETIANMTTLTEISSTHSHTANNQASSLQMGSFERKRLQELSDIRDNYDLHVSGEDVVLPPKKEEPEPTVAHPSPVISSPALDEKIESKGDAATSTPAVAQLKQGFLCDGPELRSDVSPIPIMSPEMEDRSVRSGNLPPPHIAVESLKQGNVVPSSPASASPMLDIAGRSIFFPEVDNAVVPITRERDKSELTRKALRRLSVQWTSSLLSRSNATQTAAAFPVGSPRLDLLEEEEEEEETGFQQESSGGKQQPTYQNSSPTDVNELAENGSVHNNSSDNKENEKSTETPTLFIDSPASRTEANAEDQIRNPPSVEEIGKKVEEKLSRFSFTKRKKKVLTPVNSSYLVFSDEDKESAKSAENSLAQRDKHNRIGSEGSTDGSSASEEEKYKEGQELLSEEDSLDDEDDGDVPLEETDESVGEGGDDLEGSETELNCLSAVTSVNESGFDKSERRTPATEQKRNFSRLSVGNRSASPYYLRGMMNERSPMEDCLFVCQQDVLMTWNIAFSKKMIGNCKKIGEGVYGEVFRTINPADSESVALKVIPVEGNVEVNGEPQKSFEEILPEILIAKEMSELRHASENMTPNFVEVKSVRMVQGRYPKKLLEAWDKFDQERKSENDRPDSELFPADQLFIVFEFGDGGCDLESFKLSRVSQAYSIIGQVAFALAVAEEALEFEHRDLHIGNILVKETWEETVEYRFNGLGVSLNTFGVKVFVIDFTNSRLRRDGCTIFTDLSTDDAMFEGPEDEYQFDIYRIMKDINRNEWKHFEPRSNIFWLHYLVDKMWKTMRYNGKSLDSLRDEESSEGREILRSLVQNSQELTDLRRSKDLFGMERGTFCRIVDYLLP